MKRILGCFLLVLVSRGIAQEVPSAYLVLPDTDGMRYIVNDSLVAVRPGDTVAVPAGTVVIERIVGSLAQWTAHRFVDTLMLLPGETRNAPGSLIMEHVITTRPAGATVVLDGIAIGMTPYRYAHDVMQEPLLRIEKGGFESVSLRPVREQETIDLIPVSEGARGTEGPVTPPSPSLNNESLVIGAAMLMIASSTGAAFLKEKANASLREFERTRDPAALDRVRRYDRYAGYASVTMQVSFAGFAILLTRP
jgi:hypothetical protein